MTIIYGTSNRQEPDDLHRNILIKRFEAYWETATFVGKTDSLSMIACLILLFSMH
jgi:hypothetical protein